MNILFKAGIGPGESSRLVCHEMYPRPNVCRVTKRVDFLKSARFVTLRTYPPDEQKGWEGEGGGGPCGVRQRYPREDATFTKEIHSRIRHTIRVPKLRFSRRKKKERATKRRRGGGGERSFRLDEIPSHCHWPCFSSYFQFQFPRRLCARTRLV